MIESPCAFIGGTAITSTGPLDIISDPADELPLASIGRCDAITTREAVVSASAAGTRWGRTTPAERAAALTAIADLLAARRAEFAELESRNVGMPINFAEAVVDASVDALRFFAGAARTMTGVPAGEYVAGMTSLLRREPVGVVAALVPWNVPLLMATWKLGPALASGCTIVIRPSQRTPLSALRLAQMIAAAGAVPNGVVNVVVGGHDSVGATLVQHPHIRLVALTGSVDAGRRIAMLASKRATRLHLELGGKTPVLVADDADLERAAQVIARGALDNAGQDCTAATRVLAVGPIHDRLVELLGAELTAVRIGHPSDRATELGPLIGADRRDAVLKLVEGAIEEGAVAALRPSPVGDRGWYLSPGLLVGVQEHHAIASTEIFGPVVTVERCEDIADAVRRANTSRYALAAGIWTRSLERALSLAAAIDAGKIWINEHHRDVTEMPHGGTKESGYGSDLSMLALDHYTVPKAVHIAMEGFALTTVAEVLVQRLEARGVEVVFGIPGVDNLAFFDALERSSIPCVLVRHEATAGFAADAWFRITGKPAVCFTTAGPGAANALTPMGEAWASGSTFLHLTTAVAAAYGTPLPPRGLPHYHPEQLAQFRLLASAAVHAGDPQTAADHLDDVLDAMARPPFRPGYLQVPSDLLSAQADPPATRAAVAETGRRSWAPSSASSGPETSLVARAAKLLAAAERPLIWAGSGTVSAAHAVLELAEAIGAPVVVTHSAKRGFRNMDHPLVVPYPPHEPPVTALIEGSDVALVLGSDLDAMMTRQFGLAMPGRIIQVDVERTHIGMQYPVEVAVVDTVQAFVSTLLADLSSSTAARQRDGASRAFAARSATELAIAGETENQDAVQLLTALDVAMPSDGIVVCDMSIAGYWAAGLLNLGANRRLLYPIGWGTLGFGLPAAIGASMGAPESRTLCIAGDAGAAYALGDLATMAQERLAITVLVVDDGGYGMLRYAGRQRYGRAVASDLVAPDFAAIARAFGIAACSTDIDAPDLPGVLAAAINQDGPSLVHLRATLNPPRMALLGTPRTATRAS